MCPRHQHRRIFKPSSLFPTTYIAQLERRPGRSRFRHGEKAAGGCDSSPLRPLRPSASRLTVGCRGDQKKRSWSLGEAANTNTLAALSVSDSSGEGRRRHPSPTLTRFTQRCIHCRGYACLAGPVKAFFGSSLLNQRSKTRGRGRTSTGQKRLGGVYVDGVRHARCMPHAATRRSSAHSYVKHTITKP